jgi:competence protein ComEA
MAPARSPRADPGRAGAIALGAVGIVAVLVTVFTLLRDRTPPVASAKLPPVEMVSSAQPTASGPAAEGPVIVSVVGLVHKPGLVTLSPGARIADNLRGAGGALDGADLIG